MTDDALHFVGQTQLAQRIVGFIEAEDARYDDQVEVMALAAWVQFCTPHGQNPDDVADEDGKSYREQAEEQWREWPRGFTHIGADGFRDCATAALAALREMEGNKCR